MFKFRFQEKETGTVQYKLYEQLATLYNQGVPFLAGYIVGKHISLIFTFLAGITALITILLPIEITIEEDIEE